MQFGGKSVKSVLLFGVPFTICAAILSYISYSKYLSQQNREENATDQHQTTTMEKDIEVISDALSSTKLSKQAEKVLYIMRGVPGSGKSTLSQKLLTETHKDDKGVVFSTDDYFMQNDEHVYKFNPKDLGNAHQWNQERALESMKSGVSPVIIDNTNTQKWEAKFYVEQGLDLGYQIIIKEPETTWWKQRDYKLMGEKNTHGVPADAIKKMIERWENDFTVEAILAAKPPRRGNNNRNNNNNKKEESSVESPKEGTS